MSKKNPYDVIKGRYITEKTTLLGSLKDRENNRCIAKCKTPKYVFVVDDKANKMEIAQAIESIYAESKIKVLAVNTIRTKSKPKMDRRRGRIHAGPTCKKAIITLEEGDVIPEKQ